RRSPRATLRWLGEAWTALCRWCLAEWRSPVTAPSTAPGPNLSRASAVEGTARDKATALTTGSVQRGMTVLRPIAAPDLTAEIWQSSLGKLRPSFRGGRAEEGILMIRDPWKGKSDAFLHPCCAGARAVAACAAGASPGAASPEVRRCRRSGGRPGGRHALFRRPKFRG